MERGLSGVKFCWPIFDDTFSDFFPKSQSEEINRVVRRYISSSKKR